MSPHLQTKRFLKDRRGNVAMLFGLMAIPVFGIIGTAIDYGRAIRLESRLHTAVDSAASAAIQHIGQERQVLENAARQHLDQHLPETHKGMPFSLVVSEKERSVEIRVETTIPTSLIGLMGVDKFTVRAAGLAYAPRQNALSKDLGRTIEDAMPKSAPPEVSRAIEELSRRGMGGMTGAGGGRSLSEREQEDMRRAAEDADRLIRDALSRLGR